MTCIASIAVHDVRFPTAAAGDGRGNEVVCAAILDKGHDGMAERLARLERDGLPSYTTSMGWLGPTTPGCSATMHASSIAEFSFPDGPAWR